LVTSPRLLLTAANREILKSSPENAAFYARLAHLLHPTSQLRFNAAVRRAMVAGSIQQKVAALRALAPRATRQQQAEVEAYVASIQDDWKPFLDYVQRTDSEAWTELQAWVMRACGELGQVDGLIQTFSRSGVRPKDLSARECYLFVLAFGGRPEGVGLLLRSERFLHSRDYWRAIAARAAGSADWRHIMETFARTTESESFRKAAERHLADTRDARTPALSPESTAMISEIERQVIKSATRPQAPVTAILIMLISVGFIAQISYGGSENADTLTKLGAPSPLLILEEGEWWRIVTAWFLHYGPFHFWLNFLLLAVLGGQCEVKSGSRWMLATYALGGLASSITVLSITWSGIFSSPIFVGCSGGLSAFVGSEVGGQLRDRSYWRKGLDPRRAVRRYVRFVLGVAVVLAMDVAFEIHVLHLGFAAYAPGLVVGLLISWLSAHDTIRV
jgi:rhomboid protease GluP